MATSNPLGRIPEAVFQQQVIDLAHLYGWRHLHVRRSIGKGRTWVTATNLSGWPDLLLWNCAQPGRHIAAELKADDGKTTDEQEAVLADLDAAGFETYVWRPADFDEIQGILRRRTGPT